MPLPGEATVTSASCAFARAGVTSMPVPGLLTSSTGAPGLWTIVRGESTINCWLEPLPLDDETVRISWLAPVSMEIWSPTAKFGSARHPKRGGAGRSLDVAVPGRDPVRPGHEHRGPCGIVEAGAVPAVGRRCRRASERLPAGVTDGVATVDIERGKHAARAAAVRRRDGDRRWCRRRGTA